MKKIILLTVALIACVAMLASCGLIDKITGNEQGTGGEGDGTDGTGDVIGGEIIEGTDENDGSLIWSSDESFVIVTDEETDDIGELRQYLYSLVGVAPDVNLPDSAKAQHEIVVGNIGREISDKAYLKLDRFADLYALEAEGESAYLIYAEGGCLAIAYSDTISRNAAVDYITSCIKDEEFHADGVVRSEKFNTNEFIAQYRAEQREIGFAALEEHLGKDAIDALRDFYNLYDQDLYLLLANLYDPSIGGFYYSVSARDTEGFLPDLESTGQALGAIDRAGLSSGYREEYINGSYRAWQNMLPDDIKQQLLDFAIGLQAEDKYYYHPQWGTSISTSRRGRDAGWAKTIITCLGGTPPYGSISDSDVAPTSAKGSPLTSKLSTSVVTAVSKVVPVAAKELESESAWIAYLNEANISTNSYSVFNNLNARTSEIKAAGLWNCTLQWLEDHQYDNGLWEPTVSYNSVNGLMKVSSFWNSSRPMPKAEQAVRSTLEVMEMNNIEEIEGIVFVYNPWVVLSNILPYCGDAEQELRAYILDNAETFISSTFDKISAFKRLDGGFSYYQTGSAAYSQGALVAVDGTEESDVNATSIAISTPLVYMMDVLLHDTDYEAPDLYYEYDTIYFLETIENLGPVIKKPYDGPEPWVETFEDYDPAEGMEGNGILLYPSNFIDISLGNDALDKDGNYKFFACSVTDDPAMASGKVLHMQSKVYDVSGNEDGTPNGKIDDNGLECALSGENSSAKIRIINSSVIGNCFVFETDMYFDDSFTATGSNTVMQLMFNNGAGYNPSNSVWLNFLAGLDDNGNKYLTIAENFAGADGVKSTNIVGSIPAKTWTNLRVEMYKIYDGDGNLQIRAKIYVNGIFAGESDSSNYSSTAQIYQDYVVNCISLNCFRNAGASVYLDNVYAAKMNKQYVSETPNDVETDPEVKAPSYYDFETEVTLGIKSETYSTQKADEGRQTYTQTEVKYDGERTGKYGMFFSIVADPKNSANRVLKLDSVNASSANVGTITLDAPQEAGKRVHIVEFDYYIEKNSAATTDLIQLDFLDVNGNKIGGSSTIIYNCLKSGDKAVFKLKNVTSAERLNANTWYKIRITVDSANKTICYHFSDDSGENYYIGVQDSTISSGCTIAAIRMRCNTYNNTGVQYIDNLRYTLTDTVPEAEKIVNEMAEAVNPTTKIVYDFTDGVIPSNTNFKATAVLKADANSAAVEYVVGSQEYQNYIKENGKDISSDVLHPSIGTLYYAVNDPKDASNKVLQLLTHNGSGANSYIDILGSKLSDEVGALEITFDYYTDYNKYIAKNLPSLSILLWDGQYAVDDTSSSRNLGIFAYPSGEGGAGQTGDRYAFDSNASSEATQTQILSGGIKVSSQILDSHTWYTIKIIVTGGKSNVYYTVKGSDNYTLVSSSNFTRDITTLKYVRFQTNSYNNTTRQYIDNVSYVMTDSVVAPAE